MDYKTDIQERKYNEKNRMYNGQTFFQQMYETAIRLSLSGGHLGDYSKEALEKPSEHYEGKIPKKTIRSNLTL